MALRMGRTFYTTRQVRAEDLMVDDIALFGDEWARVTQAPEATTLDHVVRIVYSPDQPNKTARDRLCQEYELVTVQVEMVIDLT